MRLLAHPFRLGPDGTAVTVEQGSPAARAQEIGELVATVRGERESVPAFGVTNPVFGHGIDIAEVHAGLALFGPPVEVTALDVTYPDPMTERVIVTWKTSEEG